MTWIQGSQNPNTPTRCSNRGSHAGMSPPGLQPVLPPGDYSFNVFQSPPEPDQSNMPHYPAHNTLIDPTIPNNTPPTFWDDSPCAMPFDQSSQPTPFMGQTPVRDCTIALQTAMQPPFFTPQLQDNPNIFRPNNATHLPAHGFEQLAPELPTRSQNPWPRRCEWVGCDYSGTFNRKAELMRHLEEKHVAPGSHICPVRRCHRSFNRGYNLRNHVRVKHVRRNDWA
ncbi:hypothetical protein P170DRAFT_422635 [Aspergillus steynii IBT 23096]|uniref:C2H2-type domain-containing protein n=1 Tax=Aspergillus steynii IBT 23096 TaxID=1392250 RepID=A0A2I2GFI7_9EURO|nr:uncharacterized protein P170DRAFT_422635 [Aspergillus steynii IBT 23096]PLB51645.1 hypothetical protein P170DRAFT_422635 [Aspergillus steynii IBT 23096]